MIYKNDFLISSCADGNYEQEKNPTCGWQRNENGAVMANSQGFCCLCSIEQLFGRKEQTRANLNCQLFGLLASSAHCLRYSELVYQAFNVGKPNKLFQISMSVDGVNEPIVLSPEVRDVNRNDIIASLQGDFEGYESPLSLDDKLLFVPLSPVDHDRVKDGSHAWMFLDQNLVDPTGFSCNKIGVSYSAFRNQPNGCGSQTMACLQNQIEDYHLGGRNFVHSVGDFSLNKTQDKLYLVNYIQSFSASVVTLSLNADSILFVYPKSPGILIKGSVEKFESLSKNGVMHVTSQNTGSIESKYSVSVTDCSVNINPVLSKSFVMDTKQQVEILFDVTTNTQFATSNVCQVRLYDTEGSILDQMEIKFDTSETLHKRDPSNVQGTPTTTNGDPGSWLLSTCPCAFIDVFCNLAAGCWIWILILLAVVILIIVFCIVFSFSGGWCFTFRLCQCCCACQRNLLSSIKLKPLVFSSRESNQTPFMFLHVYKNIKFMPKATPIPFCLGGKLRAEGEYTVFDLESRTSQKKTIQDGSIHSCDAVIPVQTVFRLKNMNQEVSLSAKFPVLN